MTWTSLLDTLERQLHRQEAALRGSGALPDGLKLHAPVVPMTADEQVRALDLLQRHDQLITQTSAVVRSTRGRSSTPYGN